MKTKMKTFREFLTESENEYKVIFIGTELWVTYSQGSGETIYVRDFKKFFTNDESDKGHFDSTVNKIVTWSKSNKPIKKSEKAKLFEISEYRSIDPSEDQGKRYDIFGGDVKPNGKIYMLVTTEKHTIINLFKTKNEALTWF